MAEPNAISHPPNVSLYYHVKG